MRQEEEEDMFLRNEIIVAHFITALINIHCVPFFFYKKKEKKKRFAAKKRNSHCSELESDNAKVFLSIPSSSSSLPFLHSRARETKYLGLPALREAFA